MPETQNSHAESTTSESGSSRRRKTAIRPAYSDAFEAAWKAWREAAGGGDKKPAFAVWEGMSAEDQALAAKAIPLFGADFRRRKAADADATPLYFERYLRNRRFDTLLEAKADTSKLVGPNGKPWGWWVGREANLKALDVERWRLAIEKAKPNGSWPWWSLGPPPGDPACLVPEALLAEHGFVAKYRGQLEATAASEVH